MLRRIVVVLACVVALLFTGCAQVSTKSLAVDEVVRMDYWRLPDATATQTASPEQIRRFVEAYGAAKPIAGDFGTTPPVTVRVVLKSGEELRVSGGGQTYSTITSVDPPQNLEGTALHQFLEGLAAQ